MSVEHHEALFSSSDDSADPNGSETTHHASDEGGSDLNEVFPEVALVRVAQAIRALRKVRREQFGLELAEPAWDMIVELYFQDSTGASTTTSQLREVSNVPGSTADRWVRMLEQDGWIAVRSHPSDASTHFVDMTEKARGAMDRYLTEVRGFALRQPTR